MFSKPLVSGLLLTALLSLSLPSQAQSSGAELYQEHCSKCHGDNGKARTLRGWLFFAKNLSKASWQSRESDDELAAAIRRGPGAMPAYEGKLTDAEIDQLVAHIRTLKQP